MKKLLTCATALVVICASAACAQSLGGLGLPGLGSLPGSISVNPTVQVGFQHVGSNMNLPIAAQGPIAGLIQIQELDISLKDASFWTGSAGVTVKAGEIFSLFGSVGGSLNRRFIVSGATPVSIGTVGGSPTVDFTGSQVSMWYAQGGLSLGPILLGVYGDHFGLVVGDPRQGSVPLNNQTLRGDVISTTLAPFIGVAIPASGALLTVMYSPLAMSKTTMVLRTSLQDLTQLQYKWNKPGNFLSTSLQYNVAPVNSVSLGLWANYTWMDVRGDAELDFEDSTRGFSRQKTVTATMTKYVIQGGLTAGITF